MRNLHTSLRVAKQQAKRLQTKVDQIIANEAIPLQPNDAEDFAQIVEDVSSTVKENFPDNSPQRVF